MVNGNFLDKMFGKIGSDCCKLSMNGDIAIKTSNGYKTYNVKSGKLTNCSNFVFNMGDMDCFFLIPTNKVQKGDIIMANGQPKCVISVDKTNNSIQVINYESSVIENILPERHVFMGNTYFYGKIVSMFGNVKKSGSKNIMKYMMMSEMMKSMNGGNSNNMMPMLMMMNGGNDMFSDMFDLMGMDDSAEDADIEDEETTEEDE